MEWSEEAIVLSASGHGETSVIAALFTHSHGRHLGLVKGGKSRRMRPVLQCGNFVQAVWRARLDEHLGHYTIELLEPVGSEFFDDPLRLAGLNSLSAGLSLFAERDPYPALYQGAKLLINEMRGSDIWPALLVRFEMELLTELGFGLDLSECAATGSVDDLVYVSPKSGRAVSGLAGQPFDNKLLRLPQFLLGDLSMPVSRLDVVEGLRLTGYFFEKQIYRPRGLTLPEVRSRLIGYLSS